MSVYRNLWWNIFFPPFQYSWERNGNDRATKHSRPLMALRRLGGVFGSITMLNLSWSNLLSLPAFLTLHIEVLNTRLQNSHKTKSSHERQKERTEKKLKLPHKPDGNEIKPFTDIIIIQISMVLEMAISLHAQAVGRKAFERFCGLIKFWIFFVR